jgi:hypothetical protein
MFNFWYFVLKVKIPSSRCCFVDTDAFLWKWDTNDHIVDLKKIEEHLDPSSLPVDHPLYSEKNRKVLGKFKDESCGNRILAFACPRAKRSTALNTQLAKQKN